MDDLLQLVNIHKYFGGVHALDGVSILVKRESRIGIVGPNGAGKSTLFNIICGIIHANEGTVLFKNLDITKSTLYKTNRLGIAKTFQASILYNQASVLENIVRACHYRGNFGLWQCIFHLDKAKESKVSDKAERLLHMFNLSPWRNMSAGSLPFGPQRHLGIAMALATEPEILLLDEPVAGMNAEERREMLKIILELNKSGLTLVIVEHDVKFILSVSERIVVLNYGKKIAEGPPEKIKTDPLVIRAFLGGKSESGNAKS